MSGLASAQNISLFAYGYFISNFSSHVPSNRTSHNSFSVEYAAYSLRFTLFDPAHCCKCTACANRTATNASSKFKRIIRNEILFSRKNKQTNRIHLNVSFAEFRKYLDNAIAAQLLHKIQYLGNVVKWRLKCTLTWAAFECENCKYACAHALEMCYNFNLNLCMCISTAFMFIKIAFMLAKKEKRAQNARWMCSYLQRFWFHYSDFMTVVRNSWNRSHFKFNYACQCHRWRQESYKCMRSFCTWLVIEKFTVEFNTHFKFEHHWH